MRYLLLLLIVAGCAATGPEYTNQQGIIVYRDKQLVGQLGGWEIEANGKHACDLHGDSYFILPKGDVTITAAKALLPGTSKIVLEGDKTQYIRIQLNPAKVGIVAAVGYVGSFAAEAATQSGPFIFTNVAEPQAKQELFGLHQDCI